MLILHDYNGWNKQNTQKAKPFNDKFYQFNFNLNDNTKVNRLRSTNMDTLAKSNVSKLFDCKCFLSLISYPQ